MREAFWRGFMGVLLTRRGPPLHAAAVLCPTRALDAGGRPARDIASNTRQILDAARVRSSHPPPGIPDAGHMQAQDGPPACSGPPPRFPSSRRDGRGARLESPSTLG